MQMQLTLAQLFGEGASQTSTSLIIQKSALRGLTPSTNNSAQSLIAAITYTAVNKFEGNLTGNGNTITGNSVIVTYNNSELYQISLEFWKKLFVNSKVKTTFLFTEYANQ